MCMGFSGQVGLSSKKLPVVAIFTVIVVCRRANKEIYSFKSFVY